MELVHSIQSGEYATNVEAEGHWELTVAQPSTPDDAVRTPPFEASGEDDDIVGPMKSMTLADIGNSLEHDGNGLGLTASYEDSNADFSWVKIDGDGTCRIEADS